MQSAIDAFYSNMLRVRSLHALYGAFARQVTAAVDLSDLLRAEVVLAVSALDQFIHELTRLGMLECWKGIRRNTDAFNRFPLPIVVAKGLSQPTSSHQIFDDEVRLKHSYLSFQLPDRIADAIRLFSNVKLWDEVGNELGKDAKTIKSSLALIVERRNKIAHEADVDPSYPGQRWPIDPAMVERICDDLEAIARAIFKVAA
jgi:RiboL-PSP-HEPN